jgi:arylformamidase
MDHFRIRDFVTDFASREADYRAASDHTRRTLGGKLDIPYGRSPRERLDLFLLDDLRSPAPVHIFIHGGYWRAGSKEDYAFVADAITGAGAIAAIVEYDLVPTVRIADQVAEVRRAAGWIAAHAAEFGGDPGRLTASGHSAGAMLCWFLGASGRAEMAAPAARPSAILLLSGIFDLAPIATSFLQPELNLSTPEITDWSPLNSRIPERTMATVAVGAEETPPFHEQAQALSAKLQGGAPVHSLPGLNHMSAVREMGRPGTAAAELLRQTIAAV